MARLVYSFVSSFFKVFVFLATVVVAYRTTAVASPTLGAWLTVPFACLAIVGAKTFVEAADHFLRCRFGWQVTLERGR